MPSDAAAADDGARRLHPVSLIFSLGALARSLAVPALAVLLFSRGQAWEKWLLVPFAISVVVEVIRYFSLTYRFTASELVISQGLLSRRDRHIPYSRVQNIEQIQNWFHRIVGVTDVRVETGGSEELEARLRVVSLAAVDELRAIVGARRGAELAGGRPALPVVSIPLRELALHGLLTGRGAVALAALLGLFWELGIETPDWLGVDTSDRAFWQQMLAPSGWKVGLWLLVLPAFVFVLRLAAAAWSILTLFAFELTQRDDELHTRYGLFTRIARTIPRQRIQLLTVQDGWWHRRLGRASVQVQTVGRSAEESGESGQQWIAPIVAVERLPGLLAVVQPDLAFADVRWQPIDPRTFRRLVPLRLLASAAIGGGLAGLVGPWAAAGGLLLAVLLVWDAWATAWRTGYAITDTSILVRTGAWTRRVSIARFSRVQSVSIVQSPLDRRWNMARVSVDTAGGGVFASGMMLPFLPVAVADGIYRRVRREIAARDLTAAA